MRTIQKFDDPYLYRCQSMTADEIVRFLDDFRQLHGDHKSKIETEVVLSNTVREKVPSKLISMKVPENLLRVFRAKTALSNTPYQTQIKQLMLDWLVNE